MAERVVKVRLLAEVADFKRGMEDAANETLKVGTAAEQLAQKREAFNQLGTAALGVGAAMTAMTVMSARAAIGWESSWAGVTKTVEGTPEQLAAVEEGLRGLTSVLPASHDEIAGVAEAAGQLGIQTENVVAFTRTMIDLGETTNLSANDAATSLARFMNIMGTAQSDVSNLGSAIVGLGNNYATTEAEIMEMAMRLAGAGKQVGLSEGQVLGLSTALSSVGIEAEAGGSAMSKVMIDIAASVEEGGARLDLFAKTAGVSAKTFADKWRSDPAAALSLFVKGLSNAEAQGSSTLGVLAELGITEVRMRDALLRSASAADLFTDAMSMGNEEFAKNNALTDEAAKRYETVESQLAIMRNAINDAAISFGSVFLPAIAAVAGGVREFASFLTDIPEPVQGIISVLTGVVGVTALVGGAALVAVPKVVAFKVAMQSLPGVTGAARGAISGLASFLGGPWGVALFAATAAFAVFNKQIEDGVPAQAEITNAIKSSATAADSLKAAFDRGSQEQVLWGDYAEELKDLPGLLDHAIDAQENWADALSTTMSQKGAYDSLKKYGEALAGIAQTDLPAAQMAFRGIRDEYKLTEDQTRRLLEEMSPFRDEVLKAADAQGIAKDSAEFLQLALGELPGSTAEAESALTAMEAEASAADEALRGTAQALADIASTAMTMGEANDRALSTINALTSAAEEEGVALDGTNDASIRFRDSIRDVETAHRDSAQAILDNGGTLAEAKTEWERGRQAVLDMLTAKGMDIDQAKAWADANLGSADQVVGAFAQVKSAVDNVPKAPVINLTARTSEAYNAIMNVQSALRSITGNHSIHVSTGQGGQGGLAFASGGRVVGPGTGTSDSIPAWLSDGEHVIPADEVQAAGGHEAIERYRAMIGRGSDVEPQYIRGSWVSGSSTTQVSVAAPQMPPVYVQNPFTGEYLLAKTSEVAGQQIVAYDDAQQRKIRRGVA